MQIIWNWKLQLCCFCTLDLGILRMILICWPDWQWVNQEVLTYRAHFNGCKMEDSKDAVHSVLQLVIDLKPPGHYLCTPEPGRLGCVISIQKGVNCGAYPVAFSQKVTKNLPVPFYSPTQGFKTLFSTWQLLCPCKDPGNGVVTKNNWQVHVNSDVILM